MLFIRVFAQYFTFSVIASEILSIKGDNEFSKINWYFKFLNRYETPKTRFKILIVRVCKLNKITNIYINWFSDSEEQL